MSVELFFERATLKQALFGESGANFQDNVILQAAFERLTGKGGKGLVITEDKHFHNRKDEIGRLGDAAGVELECVRLEGAENKLVELLKQTDRDRYLHHKETARRAVLAFLPKFQDLFNAHNERLSEAQWDEFLPTTYVKNAHFDEVADVDVPQWKADPPAGTELRLSAIVRGTATAETRYATSSGDVRSHARREIFEVGFNASATFDRSEYSVKQVHGWTHGTPGSTGTVGHADVGA